MFKSSQPVWGSSNSLTQPHTLGPKARARNINIQTATIARGKTDPLKFFTSWEKVHSGNPLTSDILPDICRYWLLKEIYITFCRYHLIVLMTSLDSFDDITREFWWHHLIFLMISLDIFDDIRTPFYQHATTCHRRYFIVDVQQISMHRFMKVCRNVWHHKKCCSSATQCCHMMFERHSIDKSFALPAIKITHP